MCEAFQRAAAVDPDAVALRTPGDTQTLTWREYAADVRRVAAGLHGIGVRRGDTVALMMANRIEFYPLEVGAQHLGATSFSVYNTLPAEQLTYVFGNAGTKVVICEQQYVDRIRASGAKLEHIICIDGAPDGTLSLDDLYAAAEDDFDFDATWRSVQPDDVITLIYTSGTTGNPKGVEMTHTNLLFEAYALDAVLDVRPDDRATSYLPSAHIADRIMALYNQELYGILVTVISDVREIAAALPDARPTIWARRATGLGKAQGGNRIRGRTRARRNQAPGFAVGPVGRRETRRGTRRRRTAARRRGRRMGAGRRTCAVEAAGEAGARQAAVGGVGCGADSPGDAGFLCRYRHPDRRSLGHVGAELRCERESSARGATGFGGQAAARAGIQDRRGWRISGAGAVGDEGLPQRAGQDR